MLAGSVQPHHDDVTLKRILAADCGGGAVEGELRVYPVEHNVLVRAIAIEDCDATFVYAGLDRQVVEDAFCEWVSIVAITASRHNDRARFFL